MLTEGTNLIYNLKGDQFGLKNIPRYARNVSLPKVFAKLKFSKFPCKVVKNSNK